MTIEYASGLMARADTAGQLLVAEELLEAGRLGDAEAVCQQVLASEPGQVEALRLRGVCERQRGAFGASAQTLQEATQREPGNALVQLDFGRTLMRLGRVPDALVAFGRAIELDDSLATAQHNLGVALENLGRFEEAIARYERSFALSRNLASLAGCANCLLALGRREQAIDTYRRILAVDPSYPDACANLGAQLMERGELLEPLVLFERTLALLPQHAAANRNHVALVEAITPRLQTLLASARDSTFALPDVETQVEAAHALALLGRNDEALNFLDAIVARQPQAHLLRCARVEAMVRGGRTDRAAEVLEEIEKLRADLPDDGRPARWRGVLDESRGNFEAARMAFRHALNTAQERFARWHLARLDLRDGQWSPGLAGLECADYDEDLGAGSRYFTEPRWQSEEDIAGGTLLVHAESNAGDAILFSRYLALVRPRARRLVFEVPTALQSLMRRCLGQYATVVGRGALLPRFDRHFPLPWLPFACGTRVETIPWAGPYLKADPARVGLWRDRLGGAGGRRIGIVWSDSSRHAPEWQRRLSLAALLKAIERGVVAGGLRLELIALQNFCRTQDVDALAAADNVRYFGNALCDFDDTAALIELCEFVIGIDAPAMHLAGAMGKPAWVMLAMASDWHWLTGRDDSPWYPPMRLLRQRVPGDWSDVLAEIASGLPLPPQGADGQNSGGAESNLDPLQSAPRPR